MIEAGRILYVERDHPNRFCQEGIQLYLERFRTTIAYDHQVNVLHQIEPRRLPLCYAF